MKTIAWALAAVTLASAAPPATNRHSVDKEQALRDYLNAPGRIALQPSADGCAAASITPGETIEGTIAPTDCDLSQVVPGAPAMFRLDAFKFIVSRNTIVTASLRSTAFEPVAVILNAEGEILADPPVGDDPAISSSSIHLPAGTYTLVAIAISGAGAYRLELAGSEPRTCTPVLWKLDEEKTSAFSATSCRGIDLAPYSTLTVPVEVYMIDNKDRKLLSIDYSSDIVQAAIALASSANQLVGTTDLALASTLRASVAPGQYVLAVAAHSLGSYRLKAATEDLRACASRPLVSGESLSGQLDSTDCRTLDLFVPSSDDTPQDVWTFEVKDRTIATLTMTSSVLDSFLSLVDSNLRILAENDDFDRQTLDSRIRISLPPGTYRALASDFELVSGAYTLKLDSEAPRACDMPLLTSEKVRGALAASDCRVFDIVAPSTETANADAYKLTVPAQGVYTLDASSAQFLATLRLYDARGVLMLTRTASRATNSAANIEVLLTPGDYTVLVSGGTSGAGVYELAMATREPKQCQPLATIGNHESSRRTLQSGSDCRVKDVIAGTTSSAPVDLVRVVVADGSTVGLQAESNAFPPLVFVLDAQGRPTAAGLNPRLSTMVQVEPRLTPGSYTIGVTSTLDLTGEYWLVTDSKQVVSAGQ